MMDWSPIVLIEGVMVLGGALAFGWWQLRDIKKDNERAKLEKEQQRSEKPE
jgi:hypothetical protein